MLKVFRGWVGNVARIIASLLLLLSLAIYRTETFHIYIPVLNYMHLSRGTFLYFTLYALSPIAL